ncbi:MAG: hypothetical protein IJO63_03980 [Bacilli bacterium]|nr:hypothetical protein [Bacilli bacterium]
MKIGIDFDNTLVNTYEVTKERLDRYLPGNNLHSYHDLDPVEEQKFFDKYYLEILENVTLYPYAKEALEELRKMGCTLVLVTARGIYSQESGKPTLKVLQKFGIEFDEYYWGNPIKGHVCKDNHIDLMIDDLQSVCEEVSSKGVKVLNFGETSDRFAYALNWKEVVEYVKKGL